ncbi:MAG: hypothetical protein ACRD0K_27250, partial [Egibacteraceae bacterium]
RAEVHPDAQAVPPKLAGQPHDLVLSAEDRQRHIEAMTLIALLGGLKGEDALDPDGTAARGHVRTAVPRTPPVRLASAGHLLATTVQPPAREGPMTL